MKIKTEVLPADQAESIVKAAELLRTTPQRVQDIAARVGYESQGRFAQAFYDQFRLTPLEYRRLSK